MFVRCSARFGSGRCGGCIDADLAASCGVVDSADGEVKMLSIDSSRGGCGGRLAGDLPYGVGTGGGSCCGIGDEDEEDDDAVQTLTGDAGRR